MKWSNKGHQFDEEAKEILSIFNRVDKIYIFGAGEVGECTKESLKYIDSELFAKFAGFIDNDKNKIKEEVEGYPVLSVDDYMRKENNSVIIVGVSEPNFIRSINKQLSSNGFVMNKDYFNMKYVLPIISTYGYDKSYCYLCCISLTERCTLKCAKCSHGCFNVSKDALDMPLDEVYQGIDAFFSKVDFCLSFNLLGGEPLLYKKLAHVIEYIGSKYRDKIYRLRVITNGTLLPNEDVLKVSRKHNVVFRISNYSNQLPYLTEKHEKLIKLLSENDVGYVLYAPDVQWLDAGFDHLCRDYDPEKLTTIFDNCDTPCREIRGNKFYFCMGARSSSQNLHIPSDESDCLYLDELTEKNYKKIFMEFNFGYSDKGYIDMCQHCYGAERVNYPIPAAEQLKHK